MGQSRTSLHLYQVLFSVHLRSVFRVRCSDAVVIHSVRSSRHWTTTHGGQAKHPEAPGFVWGRRHMRKARRPLQMPCRACIAHCRVGGSDQQIGVQGVAVSVRPRRAAPPDRFNHFEHKAGAKGTLQLQFTHACRWKVSILPQTRFGSSPWPATQERHRRRWPCVPCSAEAGSWNESSQGLHVHPRNPAHQGDTVLAVAATTPTPSISAKLGCIGDGALPLQSRTRPALKEPRWHL